MTVKIKELFEAYDKQVSLTPDVNNIFSESGMVNRYKELEFGFFPLGSGIFTDKSNIEEAEIETGGIMVLGNDFSTIYYVDNQCKNKRENNNATIRNLEKVGLEMKNTFFTNFFLGLRDNIKYPGTTNTVLIAKREFLYKEFCRDFFLTQLKLINPRIIIVIGKEVGFALRDFFGDNFRVFDNKGLTFNALFSDDAEDAYLIETNDLKLGSRKFIFIPHPSWAHVNWKNHDIKSKIEKVIQSTYATKE